jgi:hypothetical protein
MADKPSAIQIDESGKVIIKDQATREAVAAALTRLAANPESEPPGVNDRCVSNQNCNSGCRPVRE